MVSRAKKVRKNKITKFRKSLLVIGTEGDNKTEELYFRELERKQGKYHVIFARGNETDPVNIVKNTAKAAKKEEISIKKGDLAISIFDLDVDRKKVEQLLEAKKTADAGKINIFTSNPCFEVWYLEHFSYTSKYFSNSEDVIKELVKQCPNYQKNTCDIDLFYPLTKNAIQNCVLLEEHHRKYGSEKTEEFNNPRTDIYKLVQKMIEDESS